jgi:hypothetical protein
VEGVVPERLSVTDQLWGRIKNHPAAAVVIVLAAVLVGAAKVTGAVDDIITFLERRGFAGSTAETDSAGDLGAVSATLPDPGAVGFVSTLRVRAEEIALVALECDASHTLSCDDPFPFLTLGEVSYGRLQSGQGAYLVEVTLSNASDSPILLDLDQRFFVLWDDQGGLGKCWRSAA